MNTKITQDDINRTVWKACDTFRGVIDPSQYKDYILTMLFLKYVSNVYKSKFNDYLEKYSGDKERAERAMRHERFVVPEKSSFDYLFDHKNATNIGELIDEALADLEDANREKMSSEDGSSIFRNISFNSANLGEPKEKNARLKNLLQDFKEVDLDESHLDRRRVYVSGIYICRRGWQKGGRLFYAGRSVNATCKTYQKQPRSTYLRCNLRLWFVADKSRQRGRQQQFFALRTGSQRQHLGVGNDEYVSARFRQCCNPLGRHIAQSQTEKRRQTYEI